ncbi:ABC transporter ATP-binding protein [Ramlibacter sp. USB13]|uniref:ABC transporter ATP-binding protein n=1 Tax=Ramlibacter cellulosilyticus TaxID=2764187 RepID=A0A923MSL4_9BURK|nr:ABC transporter ATP-binding protein [Ramlibacter cellulosilyticus]MBC5783067.1 ABC transporter ATP-binding protein [Ramlibacter cellulosilyticus]
MGFLELQGLTKRYAGAPVVKDVSLSVDKGQLVCLLGPSGCGKTTTLRLIAGFVEPDGGEIRVGGRRISAPGDSEAPERRNMSMIFQSYALWPHMTVFDNVAYGLKLRGLSKNDTQQRAETILAATKLSQLAQRYPGELSGGQQQRVSLARALVVEPETLLLDEPLSNLDANLREEMRFEIRRLHDKYRYTTVYVTHDQAEAMTTADLIVVMNNGVIEQAGSPEDVYQRPKTEFVARFIGGTNILRGKWDGQDGVASANGLFLRCGSGEFAKDGDTAVSLRHHDVHLSATKPAETNCVQGTVTRQIYLGSHRDYLVTLPDGESVRAVAPSDFSLAPGASVWLHLPPAHCRALAH